MRYCNYMLFFSLGSKGVISTVENPVTLHLLPFQTLPFCIDLWNTNGNYSCSWKSTCGIHKVWKVKNPVHVSVICFRKEQNKQQLVLQVVFASHNSSIEKSQNTFKVFLFNFLIICTCKASHKQLVNGWVTNIYRHIKIGILATSALLCVDLGKD